MKVNISGDMSIIPPEMEYTSFLDIPPYMLELLTHCRLVSSDFCNRISMPFITLDDHGSVIYLRVVKF